MYGGNEPKKMNLGRLISLMRYTMRLRQATLNESQTYYSNRCCFCEYGKWHLPPFYLICTKTFNTVHPHFPTLCVKYGAHSNYNFKRFIFDHKFMSDPTCYENEISLKIYTNSQNI